MSKKTKAPAWFWVIALVALIWNLMGVMAYLEEVTLTDSEIAAMDINMRNLHLTTPTWATASFALAVWGGALGGLFLLLRKSWAIYAFILSLIGVMVQMYHSLFISNSIEVYGPGGMTMPVLVVIFGIAFIFFTRAAAQRNWIR